MKERVYTRDVLLAMLAALCYMCSNMMTTPIFTGYVGTLGASGFWMGAIGGLTTATSFVCRPVTGNLADRMEKFRLSLIGACMLLVANAGYVLIDYIPVVVALRVLQGTGYAFCSLGLSTWISMLLPRKKLGSGMGAYGTVNAIAMAVAPSIGIRMKDTFGYRWCFVLAALFAVITIAVLLCIRDRGRPVQTTATGKAPRGQLISLRAAPIALALFFLTIPYSANQHFLVNVVEMTGKTIRPDVFFTMYAIMLVILRVGLRKLFDRYSYTTFLLACTISSIGAIAALHLMNGYLMMFAAATLMAGGYGIMFTVSQSASVAVVGADRRGLAIGTYYVGLDLGLSLGSVIGGVLYEGFEIGMFYPLLGVFSVLSIGMYFFCRWFYGTTDTEARNT